MKNIYAYMCVAVMSYVFIVPSRAVSFRSAKRSVRTVYNKQPLHRKQVALGVPLLTLGIVLESVYGGKQKEIAARVSRLKQQLGRGANKALKKRIRKLQLQRGGHIALQVFAALSSLVGGALTISAFYNWWNSMFQPRVTTGEVMLPGGGPQVPLRGPHATLARGGVVTPAPAPGTGEGRRQPYQGGSGLLGGNRRQGRPAHTLKAEAISGCPVCTVCGARSRQTSAGRWHMDIACTGLPSQPAPKPQEQARELRVNAAIARL
ncbi:MAG: hypothetical protein WCJ17_01305 [bacterium]